MHLRSIAEVNQALLPYVPLVGQLTGKDTTLDRIKPLMALLGNPQDKIRVVHIAGTSGKTSTAYYIAALLTASGKRTGLTVSPHVDSVTERVQLDGNTISDESFCAYLGEFLDLVQQAPAKPSYFELLYAFSFWVFQKEKVDYAVIETGMGGLHDATNVAGRADKLCVITDIGYDHMHVLGKTIPEITAQKIGIVHQDNAVIMYEQGADVMEVVHNWVAAHNAPLELHVFEEDFDTFGASLDKTIPQYQQRNWLLAYAVFRHLQMRDELPEITTDVLRQTQQIQVPGRMETIHVGNKTIVMDGAHNGQKMHTFLQSFAARYPGVTPAVLLALKEGKEPADVVPQLAAVSDTFIITTFHTSQDLPAKSIDPEQLATQFRLAGAQNVMTVPDLQQAYQQLLALPHEVVIVTGSFYMLSQLREQLTTLVK